MANSTLQPHRGTLVLVLGILSLIVCQPLGIAAWVMANGDLAAMNAGTMDPSGRSTTEAGRILGIIATVLMALGVLVILGMLVLGGFAAVASNAGN